MQKKLIALAIAGLASSAAADSNVTIYGLMDFGYVRTSGNDGGVTGAKGAPIVWTAASPPATARL